MMADSLPVAGIQADQRPTATYAAALLHALARDEAAGRRPPRLTEPGMPTWKRFKGRLTARDLVELLLEDAAVIHRVPFDPGAIGGGIRLDSLPEHLAHSWLDAVGDLDTDASAADYISAQARLLGVPTRMARSDLHVVKPHQQVLELPGTGGQLAHHLVSSQSDISLQANFDVACGSWQELTLAGVVALDLAAPNTSFAHRVEVRDLRNPEHPLRQRRFDFVIGLHPDKGGLFRVADQLAIWFSDAKIVLV